MHYDKANNRIVHVVDVFYLNIINEKILVLMGKRDRGSSCLFCGPELKYLTRKQA